MQLDRDAVAGDQLLDSGEILTCTFSTMTMLSRAAAAELGEDDGEAYGLVAAKPTTAALEAAPAPQA